MIYAPLVCEARTDLPGFEAREHFVFIGNFRHPPNADAVRYLHESIWPRMRDALPQAEMHVYGAYPPRAFMDLTDRDSGFIVKGPVKDLHKTLKTYRVSLAPLRFGAGLKGKILDSCSAGVPVITTAVGAEGIFASSHSALVMDESSFVPSAIECYQEASVWSSRQADALIALAAFTPEILDRGLTDLIELKSRLAAVRSTDHTGQAFWQQTLRSTEFFSRWITAKNQA